MGKKTAKIVLRNIKEPDAWLELIEKLGLDEKARKAHFEYSEYANLEVEIDDKLNIVGGRVLPLSEA